MKQKLFFIGIVGHAMRGLALAAKRQGNEVTGLDEAAEDGAATDWLAANGLTWTRTPDPKLLDGVDLVIISGGIPADYPMLAAAKQRHIPVQSFAQYLGQLTATERSVVVAGTHGKTTTTALIAWLLESAGRHPDFLIGVQPANFDASARLAHAQVVVIEGDEYKASSLDPRAKLNYYHPDVLVLTSVEYDHPDVYPTFEAYKDAFINVIKQMPATGRLIACVDGANVTDIAKTAACPVTTYGHESGDYTARNIAYLPTGIEFDITHQGKTLGRIGTPLYGRHNVLNTLGAVAAMLAEGLTIEQINAGAATFKGTYRRFNLATPADAEVTVVDDYGHHPTEVATNLDAAKLHFPGRRIVAVVRPHTYSRTAALLKDWQQSFTDTDEVYITDIEGAREAGAEQSVSGNDIAKALKQRAHYAPDRTELIKSLKSTIKPGDVILCFTVSGYQSLAQDLAKSLNSR